MSRAMGETAAEAVPATQRRAAGVVPGPWVRWGPVEVKALGEALDPQDPKERKDTWD